MRLIHVLLIALLSTACSKSAETADVKLENEEQKTIYAIGVAISQQLKSFGLDQSEIDYVVKGIRDGMADKNGEITLEEYGAKITQLSQERAAVVAQRSAEKGKAFLEEFASKAGVIKTASGALVEITEEGTGETPTASDNVKVHYEGSLVDGTVFDSSISRGAPASFPLGGVIPCWTEGLQKLKAGSKAKLVCPADTAYGDRGAPPKIGPGATLIFQVELIEVMK
jgi:FKBP-type peptidyl-prolyl cis-trans isomerase FkpA